MKRGRPVTVPMVAAFAQVERFPSGAYFSAITHKGGAGFVCDLCKRGYLERIAHGKYQLTDKGREALREAREALGVAVG